MAASANCRSSDWSREYIELGSFPSKYMYADERKWKHILHPGMPKRGGRMKHNELYSFDAQFFGVHGQQAKVDLSPSSSTRLTPA